MRGRIFIIFIQEDSSHRDASDDTDFGAIWMNLRFHVHSMELIPIDLER